MTAPKTVQIPVGDSHVAVIDKADFDLVAPHRWRPMVSKSGKTYAYTVIGRKTVLMHRLVAGTAAGFDTDHEDRDGLNNTRGNLRTATRAENVANTPKPKRKDGRPASSKYRGVTWDRQTRRWRAGIRINGRLHNLGRFDVEEDAARAYDAAAEAEWPGFPQRNLPAEVIPS